MQDREVGISNDKPPTNGQSSVMQLLANGLVVMTHPENHNHRSQRYRLTDAGRKEIE